MSKIPVGTFWILIALALTESQAKAADADHTFLDGGVGLGFRKASWGDRAGVTLFW